MTEAAYVLLGVVLGAVINAGTTIYTERRADRRAREALHDAREARLFDFRRTAYQEFMLAASLASDAIQRAFLPGADVPPEDVFDYDRVARAESEVSLYGTPETGVAASSVFEALVAYVQQHPSRREAGDAARAALRQFTLAARRDLGVPDAPSRATSRATPPE